VNDELAQFLKQWFEDEHHVPLLTPPDAIEVYDPDEVVAEKTRVAAAA